MFTQFKSIIIAIIVITVKCDNVYTRCINDKHISFTFDDSPSNNTVNLINILNQNNVSATFFINGIHIIRDNNINIMKKLYSSNQILGSHGFSHAAMQKLNYFNQLRELYDNELIFREILNLRPFFYRPPYFSYDASIVTMTTSFGYNIIATNLNTNDWNCSTSDEIYTNFVDSLNNNSGPIVLQHDYQNLNNDVLTKMITYSKQQGYDIVSLDICLGFNKIYNDDNVYGPFLFNGV